MLHDTSNSKFNLEAPVIGPGSYEPEASAHKELMTALYPKKTVPFNATDQRNTSSPFLANPGKFLNDE